MPAPLRIWPALLAGVLGWVLLELGALLAFAVLALGNDEELAPALGEPSTHLGLQLFAEGLFIVLLVWIARRSTQSAVATFQLGPSRLSAWTFPLVLLGCYWAFSVGTTLADLFFDSGDGDDALARIVGAGAEQPLLPYLVVFAVLPALTEELLYRGFIQGRLQQRLPPWIAVAISSLFFALVHGGPQAMVMVLPVGLWLGAVAWIAGSIWPGIAAHLLVNAVATIALRFASREGEAGFEAEPDPSRWADLIVPAVVLLLLGRFLAWRARAKRRAAIPVLPVPRRPL